MKDQVLHNALYGTPAKDSKLRNPPLVSAVVQIIFPVILKIQTTDGIASFQDKLRNDYPEMEKQTVIEITPGSGANKDQLVAWQFHNEAKTWTVSLNQQSITLFTSAYDTRKDFMEKFGSVIDRFVQEFLPGRAKRIGMRYVNRIPYDTFGKVEESISDDLVGILSGGDDNVLHMLTETSFKAKEGTVTARWGKMPAQGTMDAVLLPPIQDPSWIMDVDLFTNESTLFDTPKITSVVESLAERHYAIFCWMTKEALRKVGTSK